jgi:integrase
MGKFEKDVTRAKADPTRRQHIFDAETPGLCCRVSPKGRKTFMIVARGPDGKQVWKEVGKFGDDLGEVRRTARAAVQRVKEGLPAIADAAPAPRVETFKDVADAFLERHVHKKGQGVPPLRSAPAIERQFRDLILPDWGSRPFAEIRRHDVAKLRDRISAERGPVMADRVLATLSTLFRQQADHMPDEWQPPTVKRITSGADRARSRVLFDVNADEKDLAAAGRELRLVWKAADQSGAFGAMLQMLLLTGQRRAKVAAMRWEDIDLERGTWTIPTEKREKGNAEKLRLPPMAVDILKEISPIKGNPYVFAGRGKAHLAGFSPLKVALDKKVAAANDGEPLQPWTLHDLRRTCRTLLSRAKVEPHVSERILGHALGALEKVYEHFPWNDAKAKALAKLAKLVDQIVNPVEGKVVTFARRA